MCEGGCERESVCVGCVCVCGVCVCVERESVFVREKVREKQREREIITVRKWRSVVGSENEVASTTSK